MTKQSTTIHELLNKRIEDLPRLINIIADDPDEWHDARITLPETSTVLTMAHYLCDELDDTYPRDAIWRWCMRWTSFSAIQAVLHGKNERYQQPTPRLRLVAFLSALWLGQERNVDAELEEIIGGMNQI